MADTDTTWRSWRQYSFKNCLQRYASRRTTRNNCTSSNTRIQPVLGKYVFFLQSVFQLALPLIHLSVIMHCFTHLLHVRLALTLVFFTCLCCPCHAKHPVIFYTYCQRLSINLSIPIVLSIILSIFLMYIPDEDQAKSLG